MCVGPTITIWWFLFTGANIAAPPSINLLREIILITSILSSSITSIIAISLIRFITAAYSLHIFSSTQHGQVRSFTNPIQSLKSKDILLLLTHFVPIILLLLKPELITNWL
jgi:NADH-ubiquinone oxidoreductase chain 4